MADRAAAHVDHAGHADHDLDALAGFVDDPAAVTAANDASDVIRAQALDCPECAALVADLRVLASATAALAVPARTRDFRLSPEDAARLTPTSGAAEPVAVAGRLGFDMTTPAPDHATHDPLLIAAHMDSTLDARDTERVQDWLAACSACATLRSDFEALAIATRMLPTPPRPRDFRLTASDAERARGRGWAWRRALAAFGSPRASFTRPLAVGLTTMGLAGLLIANVPSVALFGSSAGAAPSASQTEMSTDVAAPALLAPAASAAAAPGAAGAAGSPEAIQGTSASPGTDIAGEAAPGASAASRDAYANSGASPDSGSTGSESAGGASTGGDSAKGTAPDETLASEPVGGPSFLVLVSAALLLTGLALAFLRWWAGRLSDG